MNNTDNNQQSSKDRRSSLESRELLVRDVLSLILLEQYMNKNTLQNWLKRDYLNQQLFPETK